MRVLLAVNYAHLDKPPPTRIDHQLEYAQGEGPGVAHSRAGAGRRPRLAEPVASVRCGQW
jgi:hypothetical protein